MNLSKVTKKQLRAMSEGQVSAILFEAKLRAEHAVCATWFHLSEARPLFNVRMMERLERAINSMDIALRCVSVLMEGSLTDNQRALCDQFFDLRKRARREDAALRSKWFSMKIKPGFGTRQA